LSAKRSRKISFVELTVIGPDRTGIVASVTKFVFNRGGNIEAVEQNVLKGIFYMTLRISIKSKEFSKESFEKGASSIGKRLGMEIKIRYEQEGSLKNMAILVTKEENTLKALLEAREKGRIRVNVPLVIGTTATLEGIVGDHGIPFHHVESSDQEGRETRILQLLETSHIDLIVLARYMRILSPRFIWRYPNRIINIHPSLLPAFPGAMAYMQAFERGVRVSGVTAHFATVDVDQGPIIWQESFEIRPNESLNSIKLRGRRAEAKTLLKAVSLYLDDRIGIRWGKVSIKY